MKCLLILSHFMWRKLVTTGCLRRCLCSLDCAMYHSDCVSGSATFSASEAALPGFSLWFSTSLATAYGETAVADCGCAWTGRSSLNAKVGVIQLAHCIAAFHILHGSSHV